MMRSHYRLFGLTVALLGVLLWGNGLVFNARAQVGSGVIRVANSGQDVDGCGSEAQPCATIARAVDQARDYIPQVFRTAEVRVAKGTYKQSAADKKTSVAMLNFNGTFTLRGGYSTSNWNTSDPTANETIIDGENTYRGVSIVPLNKTATAGCNIEVSNFTIINGRAGSLSTTYDGPAGGGVVVNNDCANARLSNLIVKNSTAQGTGNDFGTGGGIAIQGSDAQCGATTVTLTNITLTNNVAQGSGAGIANGGGLYVICGTVRASNLTISGNSAKVGTYDYTTGGGISLIKTPAFTLSNLRVTQNTADGGNGKVGEGGGMFVELSTGTISNATISGNVAKGNIGGGSGIYAPSSNLTIENSVISQNQSVSLGDFAFGGGGLLVNSTSSFTAGGPKVAGTLTGRNLFIGGNTVTSPTSSPGGGLFCDGVTLNLNNITVANNVLAGPGDNYGAALAFIGGCSGKVSNSIVAQSGARAPVFGNTQTGRVTFDTTLFNVAAPSPFEDPGQKFTNTNPLTGDPAFASATDFHISAGSAAIDKATGATPAEARDIDGETRPAGSAADLGADELSSADARANAPITLNAAATTGSISLSWTAPANPFVEQYQITYAPTTALTTRAAAVTVTLPNSQTSYTISGLTADATYTVTLTALGGGAQVGIATKQVAVTPGTPVVTPVTPVVTPTGTLTFTYLPLTTR